MCLKYGIFSFLNTDVTWLPVVVNKRSQLSLRRHYRWFLLLVFTSYREDGLLRPHPPTSLYIRDGKTIRPLHLDVFMHQQLWRMLLFIFVAVKVHVYSTWDRIPPLVPNLMHAWCLCTYVCKGRPSVSHYYKLGGKTAPAVVVNRGGDGALRLPGEADDSVSCEGDEASWKCNARARWSLLIIGCVSTKKKRRNKRGVVMFNAVRLIVCSSRSQM